MILKGSQRGMGRKLVVHLLNARTNDHVEIAEMRGVAAEDLIGALLEVEATAAGTRATEPFFTVSFNPPEEADITASQFATAFAAVEKKFGLAEQPRCVVFHEKKGRRHAHVVWSRIDIERMKAIPLPHFKRKLGDVSRSLYREFGLTAPAGLSDRARADPKNYGHKARHQVEKLGLDPQTFKAVILDAFRQADSGRAFAAALESHGFMLARGDRRGFVMVHHSGEPLPLQRFLGLKSAEIKTKLGEPSHYATLDQAISLLRDRRAAGGEEQVRALRARHAEERRPLLAAVAGLRETHRGERKGLYELQAARWRDEAFGRAERLRTGLTGFWQRFTGEHGRIVRQNADERRDAEARDQAERHAMSRRQLEESRPLQAQLRRLQERQRRELAAGDELEAEEGNPPRRAKRAGPPLSHPRPEAGPVRLTG